MPSKQLEALVGDNDPWNRHLVTAWRACASPGLVEPPSRPTAIISEDHDNDGTFDRIAFLLPLLHVLMFGLGWSRMDRGLSRWLELGRPTEEPVLDAVQRWWGDDVEGFIAWLVLNPHIIATFQTGLMGERAPALDDVDDKYAALRRDPRWKVVWSGPGDSMHLKDHVVAPLTPTNSENFYSSPELDKAGVPRAAMVTSSYAGWYDALRSQASPTRVQGRDVRVDVTCTPIGWLGQFRRSTVTGLWFRGPHALHMLGN